VTTLLVVWRLDRLGRSLPELVKLVGDLGAGRREIQEPDGTDRHQARSSSEHACYRSTIIITTQSEEDPLIVPLLLSEQTVIPHQSDR